MNRICIAQKGPILPYLDRFLTEVSRIDQASAKWTLSQLFGMLAGDMSTSQRRQAQQIMQHNLATLHDWIVLNLSMRTLGEWAENDESLQNWMRPHLERLETDSRRSVAKEARKTWHRLFGDK